MSKLYIAAHDRWAAEHVAAFLWTMGHSITSTWHTEEFLPTDHHSPEDCIMIAERDVREVCAADGVVLIAGREKVSGGKFVEAGIAIGQFKPVFILGHRENMLLWHPTAIVCKDPEDLQGAIMKELNYGNGTRTHQHLRSAGSPWRRTAADGDRTADR